MLLAIRKEAVANPVSEAKEVVDYFKASVDRFVVNDADTVKELYSSIMKAARSAAKTHNYDEMVPLLEKGCSLLKAAIEEEVPDFFALGCWTVLDGNVLGDEDATALNKKTAASLGSPFIIGFIADIKKAYPECFEVQSVTYNTHSVSGYSNHVRVSGS